MTTNGHESESKYLWDTSMMYQKNPEHSAGAATLQYTIATCRHARRPENLFNQEPLTLSSIATVCVSSKQLKLKAIKHTGKMQSGKNAVANVTHSAKAGVEKAKATVTGGGTGHHTGTHPTSALPGHGAGHNVLGGSHPIGTGTGHHTGTHATSALPGHGAGHNLLGGSHPTGTGTGHHTGTHPTSVLPGHGAGHHKLG
ncbi:jacalin-related lectin 34-like [Corylus avellana]|uniref:jacalin-related lectin 34-like n=1 Tax=Corylus avellana TaxID=13451 RepID=UPI001E20429A|nr:jacalin-related lectin 34-like [Corylus avellana]